MIEKLEKCPICKAEDFQYLDELRNHDYWYRRDYREKDEPVSFKICKNCAFVTYDYKPESELVSLYEQQRTLMRADNIVTGTRKNAFHLKFLKDIIQNQPLKKVLDIGCAYGAFLSLFPPHVERYGTEYSTAFANFARHEYGVNILTDYTAPGHTYDLIAMYHVLEHLQNPDAELQKVHNVLSDEGFLYIAVPEYFKNLEEASGAACVDFENLFHLNHVNCFSKKALYNILHAAGFEIVFCDNETYGVTVICKKSKKKAVITDNYLEIKNKLVGYKTAIELCNQKKFDEALAIEPLYPDAYILKSIGFENMKKFETSVPIVEAGLALMPENAKLQFHLARMLFQWDEQTPDNTFYSNNIRRSEELMLQSYATNPGNEDVLFFLSIIASKYKKDYAAAVELTREIIARNPLKMTECIQHLSYYYNNF